MADVREGDVVNFHPDRDHGWFRVLEIRIIPSGEIILSGETNVQSIKAGRFDLIGLQVPKVVALGDPQPATGEPHQTADGLTVIPGPH